MKDPFADWPPIIHSAARSRLIFWRDAALTALMWGILLLILYSELAFALAAVDVLLGRSEAEIDAELDIFFRRMQPLLRLVGGLVLMLAIATIASRRRRREALATPQPLPIGDAELAAIAGLDEASLVTARSIRCAVAARTDNGLAVTVAPPQPLVEAAPVARS